MKVSSFSIHICDQISDLLRNTAQPLTGLVTPSFVHLCPVFLCEKKNESMIHNLTA